MTGIFTVGLDFAVAFTSPSFNSPSRWKKGVIIRDVELHFFNAIAFCFTCSFGHCSKEYIFVNKVSAISEKALVILLCDL
jgi:hypothetical protein